MIEYEFIAITRTDGGLTIKRMPVSCPAGEGVGYDPATAEALGFRREDDRWVRELTDEMIAAEIARNPKFDGATWRRVSEADLPADRTFREAWSDDGKGLTENIEKARDVVRKRIRAARSDRFVSLDNAMKPLEFKAAMGTLTGDDKLAMTGLEAQRQMLRDAPADPAIDGAKTVADLKAHLEAFAA